MIHNQGITINYKSCLVFDSYPSSETSIFKWLGYIYSTLALKPIWLLNDLAVSNQFRGRGLAKVLMNGALEFAKESGAIRIEFKTEMTNTRAQALYRSLGFSIDDDNVYYRVTC